MTDNYIGWKMFDKVTIVAKQMRGRKYEENF